MLELMISTNDILNMHNRYFAEHAEKMRADGQARFGGKFTANRRIIAVAGGFHQPQPVVNLLYFGVRGRAQALRYILQDNDIKFSFEVVESDVWTGMKNTHAAGPCKMLPVLEWNGLQATQTEGIALFLGHKLHLLGDTDEQIATSSALTSCAYQDVISPLMNLLWSPVRSPSSLLSESIDAWMRKLRSVVGCLDQLIARGYSKLLIGHYFAFYAVELLVDVFGARLLDPFPHLAQFLQDTKQRKGIQEVNHGLVDEITRSPKEKEVRAALASVW